MLKQLGMLACLGVAACGGGGGGGDGLPLHITVTPTPVTASIAQVDTPGTVTFHATVSGETSASSIYVLIADAAGNFAGQAVVQQTGASTYDARLTTVDNLAVGSHPGNLQVRVCADPQCAQLLGSTTASYALTITPSPEVVATPAPATLRTSAVKNDIAVSYTVQFQPQGSTYSATYARLVDSAGVLQVAGGPTVSYLPGSPLSVSVELVPATAAGAHSGNLDLVFCKDTACAKMYGGVTHLPYTVTVYEQTNLTTLQPLAGAADWQTLQGNAAHTGYVPVTLDPAAFSPRWLFKAPGGTGLPFLLDTATAGDKAFTFAFGESTAPLLTALRESDGKVAWKKTISNAATGPFSSPEPLDNPATANGGVYVSRSANDDQNGGLFEGFALADGKALFPRARLAAPPGGYGEFEYQPGATSPYLIAGSSGYMTPTGNALLLLAQAQAGTPAFFAADGASGAATEQWSGCVKNLSNGGFSGTAAYDAQGNAYVMSSSGLLQGNTCTLIVTDGSTLVYGAAPVAVPGSGDVVMVGGGNLAVFDTTQGKLKWSLVSGSPPSQNIFIGSPAVAEGTLYVQNGRPFQLEARSETDGQVQWTWTPGGPDDTSFTANVIATRNLVFVSTDKQVYAIDTATHQTVWTYPYVGRLALSANGILYVRRNRNGIDEPDSLAAINLH